MLPSRAALDLIGRRPTPTELTSFVDDTDPDKRNQMVAQRMDDPSYGRNWGRYWRDVILYRRTDQRARVTAKELGDFLMRKLNSNAPWDQVAREFITATGNVHENGNTALIVAQSGKPEETVAEISRIFMGIQIQCAQCHDHPYDRWTRRQFHELAAFFPRVAVRPDRMAMQRSFVVVAHDRNRRRRRKNDNNKRVYCILRSMTSKEGSHPRASFLMHTGYVPTASVRHPTWGSVVTHEIADTGSDLPSFVRIGNAASNAPGAGFFGVRFDPFVMRSASRTPDNTEVIAGSEKFQRRLRLMNELGRKGTVAGLRAVADDHRELYQRAARLVLSPKMEAFEIDQETDRVREAYGRSKFGNGCLLARRLVESGVTFVEVAHGDLGYAPGQFRSEPAIVWRNGSALRAIVARPQGSGPVGTNTRHLDGRIRANSEDQRARRPGPLSKSV